MDVWIDQDLCTGDGLCEETSPGVFVLRDGIAYVKATNGAPQFTGGSSSMVPIPDHLLDSVLDAAENCPGECIFIEV
jgi:ferredoxin